MATNQMTTRSISRPLVERVENINADRAFGPVRGDCKRVTVVHGRNFYVVEDMEKDMNAVAREWEEGVQERLRLALRGAFERVKETVSIAGGIERVKNLAAGLKGGQALERMNVRKRKKKKEKNKINTIGR